MPDPLTRRCIKCGEVKPCTEFGRNAARPDGVHAWCRECVRIAGAIARQAARQTMATEGTKPCTRCGEVKPVTEFSPGSGKYGRRSWCRACCHKANRARYLARDDAARRIAYERTRRWVEANPDIMREAVRKRDAEIKARVFGHYGIACACCGVTGDLTIDHIAGNGTRHREELFGGGQSARRFWRWLVSQGFPDGYQTLCRSCNSSKGSSEACRLEH